MDLQFDELAGQYDNTRRLPGAVSERITNAIIQLVDAWPETTFLELGIGTGRIALPFIERGYAYTGIDLSMPMLALCCQKLGGYPCRLVQANAVRLPFKDASFHVAMSVHVLYLIPRWKQVLAEVHRVLVRSGLYLHCAEEAEPNGIAIAIDQQWQAILSQMGQEPAWRGIPGTSTDEILAALRVQGATIDSITAAEWRADRSLRHYLAAYPTRMRSLHHHLSDDIFTIATRTLQNWAAITFEDDATLSHDLRFTVHVARY